MRRVHVHCFYPSVRQSVLLFCHRNSSGTARRNFLILCHYQGHFFILGVMPLLNLEENSLSSQLSRVSCNFLVKVNIPFRCAYSLEILIWIFFWENIDLWSKCNILFATCLNLIKISCFDPLPLFKRCLNSGSGSKQLILIRLQLVWNQFSTCQWILMLRYVFDSERPNVSQM